MMIEGDGADFFAPEELDPELQSYLHHDSTLGHLLQHPLVYSIPHTEKLNRFVNRMLHAKREKLEQSLRDGDWNRYVFLHERPYRVDAICQIRDRMSDEQYWSMIGHQWRDAENIFQTRKCWMELLKARRPGRDQMMNEEARVELIGMTDPLIVFRGSDVRRGVRGLSWSLDRDVALRLGSRYQGHPRRSTIALARGVVEKRHVLAYFPERGEAEIVVLPNRVRAITISETQRYTRRAA